MHVLSNSLVFVTLVALNIIGVQSITCTAGEGGSIGPDGEVRCEACLPGSFSTDGIRCVRCPAGTYSTAAN